MPLFGRRSVPEVRVDNLMGDQSAHHLAAELAAGRWQELHDFLAATQDPEDRFFHVNQLSRTIGHRPEWVDEWRAARPGSALPALFSGALYVRSAWEARGALRGKYVTQDAARLFHQRLVLADRDLAAAADSTGGSDSACGVDMGCPGPFSRPARAVPAVHGG